MRYYCFSALLVFCLLFSPLTRLQAQITLPWVEDFETATAATYTANAPIAGLTGWTFEPSTSFGRLRTEAGAGYYNSGNRAMTLDVSANFNFSQNYLIATLNMTSYSIGDGVVLGFSYMSHGDNSNFNRDAVWIRGSDTDVWIRVFDLDPSSTSSGDWNHISGLDVDNILSLNGQTYSTTFQIRFGQYDRLGSTSPSFSDGITFDDIELSLGGGACFSEDFGGGLPSGWLITNYGSGSNWNVGTSANVGATTDFENTWLFTDAITLNSGTTYTLEYTYNAGSACMVCDDAEWAVRLTSAQNNSSTVLTLGTESEVSSSGTLTYTFTPAASGTYYLAWHNFSGDEQSPSLSVDNIELTGCLRPFTCASTGPPMAGNYVIDAGGGGDFLTIQCAMDNLVTRGVGGPVDIAIAPGSGPYSESPKLIGNVAGTSATDTVRINGNGETLEFAPDADNDAAFRIEQADYITFDNFRVDVSGGGFGYCNAFRFEDGATHCALVNSDLIGSTPQTSPSGRASLVYVVHFNPATSVGDICRFLRIENNSITSAGVGIKVYGPNNPTESELYIAGNTITDISRRGIDFRGGHSDIIYSNEIEVGISSTSSVEGINYFQSPGSFEITANKVRVTGLRSTGSVYGIDIMDSHAVPTDRALVANNFVSVFGVGRFAHGIRSIQVGTNSDYFDVYHNNVNIDLSSPAGSNSACYNTQGTSVSSQTNLFNNVFVNNTSGGFAIRQTGGDATEAENAIFRCDYNNLYAPSGHVGHNGPAATSYTTLANWQAGPQAFDQNSISVDPLYTSSTDLHVAEPLLKAGTNLLTTVPIDIDGEARATTPTMGADEIRCAIGAGPMAGDYAVDPSVLSAFPTIQCAVDNLVARGVSAAVTIDIEPGIYNERVEMTDIAGTSPTNRVTFRSSTGDSSVVIVQYATTTNVGERQVWFVENTDYITLESLTLENIGTGSQRQILLLSAIANEINGFELRKCHMITEANASTPSQDKAAMYLIHNINDINATVVENCFFDGGSSGVLSQSSTPSVTSSGFDIIGNRFENIGGLAVIGARSMDDVEIIGNTITITANGTNYGIILDDVELGSGGRNLVANNMITDNAGTTTGDFNGIRVEDTHNTMVYYNSVYVANRSSNSSAIELATGNSGLQVRNNALQLNGAGRVLGVDDASAAGTLNYNNYFHGTGGTLAYADATTTDFLSLAAWQGASSQDVNSMNVSPGFQSSTSLYLVASSPLIDQAQSLATVTTDIDGELRNPDIGADEFLPPLPVELIGFHAKLTDEHDVQLDWTTASEVNSSHFIVERRHKNGGFSALGQRAAAGKSTGAMQYDYLDVQPPNGLLYYRLRIVDLDGTAEYSRTVNVLIAEDGQLLMQVYPNPASNVINLNFDGLNPNSTVDVQLVDVAGRVVLERDYTYREGRLIGLPMQQLGAGLYTIRVKAGGEQLIARIVKQ